MAELQQVDDRCYVWRSPVNIGIIRLSAETVALVDTGLGKDPVRKVLRAIDAAGWGRVTTILTTHAHADHIGGSAFTVQRVGATVVAPAGERGVIEDPARAPDGMWGASAPVLLRGRFLQGAPSQVDRTYTGDRIDVEDLSIAIIPLPGHSSDQVGLGVGTVFYCADIVFPEETLRKHPVPVVRSVGDQLASLDRAESLDFSWFVPGHGDVMDPEAFRSAVAENRRVIRRLIAATRAAVCRGSTEEDVVATVLADVGDTPTDPVALVLSRTTVRAALSWLLDCGEISVSVRGGRLVFEPAAPAT